MDFHAIQRFHRLQENPCEAGGYLYPRAIRLDLAVLGEMPGACRSMRALAAQRVGDLDELPVGIEVDLPPMRHRVCKPCVSVVFTDEALPAGAGIELEATCAGVMRPHEIPRLHRLVFIVDEHGVVCARAAEVPSPLRLRVIRVGARIDEDLAVADVEHERQRVGMTMRREAEVAQRSRIGHQPHFVRCFERRAE